MKTRTELQQLVADLMGEIVGRDINLDDTSPDERSAFAILIVLYNALGGESSLEDLTMSCIEHDRGAEA